MYQKIYGGLLLFVSNIVLSQSATTTFTTICNASQFTHLENLIGSIHRYAPRGVNITIGDGGLTIGQRRLLSLYQRVTVVPLTKIEHIGRQVAVTDELIDYDNERFISRSRSSEASFEMWPHSDSIRKRSRIAVVTPFIRSQLPKLIQQLNASTRFTPCRSLMSVDLVLYHNERWNSSLENSIYQILDQYNPIIRRCYRRVRILAANLACANDSYFLGSAIMWRKLIDDTGGISLSSMGYTHFFLMEVDTLPIRNYWIDAIRERIHEGRRDQYMSTSWWILGSIYRGTSSMGPCTAHINGNAIYHLSSNFIAFIRFFWQLYSKQRRIGYDQAIAFGLNHDVHYDRIWRSIWHQFRYSNFIQNCRHTGCGKNKTQFALDNPQTYLVHRAPISMKDPFIALKLMQPNWAVHEPPSFSPNSTRILQLLLLIFLIFIVNILLRRRCRQAYCIVYRQLQLCEIFPSRRRMRKPIGIYLRK